MTGPPPRPADGSLRALAGTSSSPIRIAFILHVMQVAGAEMLVAETIRRLGSRIDPVVLCLDGVGALGETMRREGVPVLALERRPGLDIALTGRLAAEFTRRRIEVVHAHQYTPFFYSALARLRVGSRLHVILTEHGRHYPDVVSRRRRLLNRWVLSHLVDDITGVSEFSARSLELADGFSTRPITVIGNGVDLERYSPAADRERSLRQFALDSSRRYIGCIARFHGVKDHATLIRGFAVVARSRGDVDLVLAGDGPLRPDIERLAEELAIAHRVKFLGVQSDVPALLNVFDVFAMTSLSEAASITVLEAMAASRPIVVTAVGGNPELVRHGHEGLLVPRGDASATADALLTLLDHPERARSMGQSGLDRVRAHFRLDDTIAKYYDRYLAGGDHVRRTSRR